MNIVIRSLSFAALVMGCCTSLFAQAKVVEVPFEFYKNELVAEVMIDGKGPFMMMLDTGTDPSAIDLATAEAIGIKRSGKGQTASGGGTDKNPAFGCRLKNVRLGAITVDNLDAAAIDLSKISERMGKHIDGVLGHSFLNKRIVQFDYPRNIVRFFERAPTASARAYTLKFRYSDNILIDDVWINGAKAVGTLDTGSSGTFALTPGAVARLGLAGEVEKATVQTSVGYNGKYENRLGKLAAIKIDGLEVRDVDVIYFGTANGHDKRAWDINIGNGFLKDYVVTVDYVNKTVTFESGRT